MFDRRHSIASICVGASKCGTTWLDELLRTQYCDRMPQVKETFFFDRNFQKGLSWYEDQFPTDCSNPIEIAPSYLAIPHAVTKMANTFARRRILVMVRDPYARAASDLVHNVNRGNVFLQQDTLCVNETAANFAIENSRYSECVQQWLSQQPDFLAVVRFPITDCQWFAKILSRFLGNAIGKISTSDINQLRETKVYEGHVLQSRWLASMASVARRWIPATLKSRLRKQKFGHDPVASQRIKELALEYAHQHFDFRAEIEWMDQEVGSVGREFTSDVQASLPA